eukprot:6535900-Alexandrium_andersonii.AAC.1
MEKPPLNPRVVLNAFRRAGASSAGCDGWLPAEMANVPYPAARMLVHIIRLVEAGHGWPNQVRVAKLVHLSKTQQLSLSELQYRGLLVASAFYRGWAKMRLAQSRRWMS